MTTRQELVARQNEIAQLLELKIASLAGIPEDRRPFLEGEIAALEAQQAQSLQDLARMPEPQQPDLSLGPIFEELASGRAS